jgi:hypothetical protein
MSRRTRPAAAPSPAPIDDVHPADQTAATDERLELALAAAVAILAAAVYFSGRLEFSNIDEYNGRRFAGDFLGQLRGIVVEDLGAGRFRPMYWVFQGALTGITGSSATILMAGRLAFLAAGGWFQYRLSRRVGASRPVAALLSWALAWSPTALAIWTPGGPAEAFGTPLSVACAYLVLVTTTPRGVLAAAAVGLLAALTKESYAAWTAAALGALALSELLRSRRGPVLWLAGSAAVLQLVPAIIATQGPKQLGGSYLDYVVHSISGTPAQVWRMLETQLPLAVVAGAIGLAVIAVRLLRTRLRAWPLEDLLVLAVLGAALAEVFALGLTMPRYLVPVCTGLLLVAARGASALPGPRRPVALATVAVLAVCVLPGGLRAGMVARMAAADRRVDGRLRAHIAEALSTHGAVRIYWYPSMVEQPVGALTHLKLDGLAKGEVQLLPCVRPHPSEAALLAGIFAPYAAPVSKPAPIIVSTLCPKVGQGPLIETACAIGLPNLVTPGLPSYGCAEKHEYSKQFAAQ